MQINYHNERVKFSVGDVVIHVDDEGETHRMKVQGVTNQLELVSMDGKEHGWEFSQTCFHA